MKGYRALADLLRDVLKNEPDLTEKREKELKEEIEVFDFLGDCTETQKFELIDSNAFNAIIRGYVLIALKRVTDDEDIIIAEMESLFDHNAKDAEEYFIEWKGEQA